MFLSNGLPILNVATREELPIISQAEITPTLPKEIQKSRPKVLFGAVDWPAGLIEVASWAKREDVADPVVFRMEPVKRRDVFLVTEKTKQLIRLYAAKNHVERSVYFRDDHRLRDDVVEAIASVGEKFIEKLIAHSPQVVGFRAEGHKIDELKTRLRAVRLFSDAHVVLGGPTVMSHPVDVLDRTGADYVLAGEAELTFNDLMKVLGARDRKAMLTPEDRKHMSTIPGLAYRHAGKTFHNTLMEDGYGRTILDDGTVMTGDERKRLTYLKRPFAPDEVMEANVLDWSLLENFDTKTIRALNYIGSRGCPGLCTFCSRLHGRTFRAKSAKSLMDEVIRLDKAVESGWIKAEVGEVYKLVPDPAWNTRKGSWLNLLDEDFFLDRKRAFEFLQLWEGSPLKDKYRLNLQTNPKSLLRDDGQVDEELLGFIDRLKIHTNVGAESFNDEVLSRWRKRHNSTELKTVLDGLDRTGQDYTVYIILADYDTTPDEYMESLRLLVVNAIRRKNMYSSVNVCTQPHYDSDIRKSLEFSGRLTDRSVKCIEDYYRVHPQLGDTIVMNLLDESSVWFAGIITRPEDQRLTHTQAFIRAKKYIDDSYESAEDGSPRKKTLERLKTKALEAHAEICDIEYPGMGAMILRINRKPQ